MNNEYLARAKEQISDAKTLIILASKRARALAYGARPMVRCKEENFLDVALLEIAEGLLSYEFITPDQAAEVSEENVEVTEKEDQE